MKSTEEIIHIARTNKRLLVKRLSEGSSYLSKNLNNYLQHELNAMLLLTIENPIELCRFLKTPFSELEYLINYPGYNHYNIPKKKGGRREIFAPSARLKSIQKRLNYYLQAYYLLIKPKEVHGFVVNPHYLGTYCNIVENAKIHTKKKYVLNIDLKNFFPSISAWNIKTLFLSETFKYSEQIATAFTLLTTFEGKLPIGAPTSPVISNFICIKLDQDLSAFCILNTFEYSRYADDLTFSSDLPIIEDQILEIIDLIKRHGFNINEKKLRLKASCQKQTVTGLTVNDKVNVDRKLIRKTRAMLHDLTTNGIDIATQRHFNFPFEVGPELRRNFISRLEGYINFIGQVRGRFDLLYIKYKLTFDEVFILKDVE